MAPVVAEALSPDAEMWQALVLGTRDFVRKNGFTDVVIGLSGGIDSALVATIAVDAVGADHVHGVLMPSRYSSEHSVDDAEALARNLGIEHRSVPIEPAHAAFMDMLAPSFADHPLGLTEENLQSRVRAVVLMALSNAFGWLLLNTGNKSEASVGYSTLYGDTAGGYAVIKDVGKLGVYRLCLYRNALAGRELIPREHHRQAPLGRAAPGSARRPEPARLRRARPDPRPPTSNGIAAPTRSWRRGPTRPSSNASCASSIVPSSSVGNRHRGPASRRRASARIGASPSRTATRAERHPARR